MAATAGWSQVPQSDDATKKLAHDVLQELIEINNQFYPDVPLSISTGIATSRSGDRLEQVVKRADMKMLHAKRMYHLRSSGNRRKTGAKTTTA